VNKEEIEKYMKAGRSHSICIDRSLSIDFPGFVRAITIREGKGVSVEHEVHGMDEGGAYYWANFPTLEDAIPVLESFLGRPMESWENFLRSGKYPERSNLQVTLPVNVGRNIVITENADGRKPAEQVLREHGKIR
jgi:hypothetical protein